MIELFDLAPIIYIDYFKINGDINGDLIEDDVFYGDRFKINGDINRDLIKDDAFYGIDLKLTEILIET